MAETSLVPASDAPESFGRRTFRHLGVDRAVVLAVGGKIWSMASGLVTTLLVATHFQPELQGYYYTFLAILALQVFAELGLGVVITSYASHEWSKLGFDAAGRVVGDADALSRLRSLAGFALKWYLAAGVLVIVCLAVGGFVFFGSTGWAVVDVWGAPWAALCVITGANLCFIPFWALLEGCNQVSRVYAFRLLQSIAVSSAAWLAIFLGAGLWVAPIMGAVALAVAALTLGRRFAPFFRDILAAPGDGPRFDWRHDILPMQWRVALSWLSGYFTFSLFTPVVFHYHGAVVGGQMGMTWALIGMLTGIASSWIATRAPSFGMLIAQERYGELDRALWRLTTVVVAVITVGGILIWSFVFALGELNHPLASRLLGPADTACLIVAMIMVSASLPMATYLRAHKKEPLLKLSLVSGLITGTAVLVLGRLFAAHGVAIGFLVTTALVTPFVALIWHRRRIEWHSAQPHAF